MLDAGAKSVRAIASHCVMSDPASFRVQESALTEWYLPTASHTQRNARK